MPAREDIHALVRPDRVHRRVYTDPAVFAAELRRIFGRAWLYVGHTSQIPAPGDFFRERLGDREILVCRHADGEVHAFHNRCAHRGMMVCEARAGNAGRFVCPYHGWAYRTDGRLVGVPHAGGYPGGIDFADPARGLHRVPRVAGYRGFVFASLAADGPDLAAYLGPMTGTIDNFVDRSPKGELQRAGGGFRVTYRGNWKLHMENATDLMHAGVVHESSVASARAVADSLASPAERDHGLQMIEANGLPLSEMDGVAIRGFDGGHSHMGGFYRGGAVAQTAGDPVLDAYRAAMIEAYGRERAEEILGWDTFNHLIYPNLILNPKHQQFRQVQPVAADRSIVRSGCFRLAGAPDGMFHRAVRFLSTLNSPASMIASDDNAVFAGCQRALEGDDSEWIDLGRGHGADRPHEEGGLAGAVGTSELSIRTQYRAWLDHMGRGGRAERPMQPRETKP